MSPTNLPCDAGVPSGYQVRVSSGGQVEVLPSDDQVSKRISWRRSSEKFGDITMMISRWEAQEVEEKTSVLEMVRGRRRSTNIDKIVQELNLESEDIIQTSEEPELRDSSGGSDPPSNEKLKSSLLWMN